MQGPVQGPGEEVQGPCARATNPVNRNGCKGHLDMSKGHKKRCKDLWCVQGPPAYLMKRTKPYLILTIGSKLREVEKCLMISGISFNYMYIQISNYYRQKIPYFSLALTRQERFHFRIYKSDWISVITDTLWFTVITLSSFWVDI